MSKPSYFEEAGFNKEMAQKLEDLCVERNIPFEKLLKAIQKRNSHTYLSQREIDEIFEVFK